MSAALVASANAAVGADAAVEILAAGGAAIDAVETCIRAVESNPDDHTVGYGGWPNLRGEVELDASLMVGDDRSAGTVGALRGYRHAITVARAVLERLPHTTVVGDGAASLAAEIGLEPEDLLTAEAAELWRSGLSGEAVEGLGGEMLATVAALVVDPEKAAGTVDVIARDRTGSIVSGVSTSGWAWKHPGRLGDTPIIGAGNYADSRHGAAACTGWGELSIRAGTARMVVARLAAGASVADAGREAVADVNGLDTGGHHPTMHVVVLGADGTAGGFSNEPDKRYLHWHDGEPAVTIATRTHVAVDAG